jgi:histone H3/H4
MMQNMQPQDEVVRTIHQQAEEELQTTEPSPFSPNGFSVLQEKVSDYIKDLIYESSKLAIHQQADTISAAHVERASEYLVTSNSKRKYRHLGTLGGIVLGAGLSSIMSMSTTGKFPVTPTIVSIIFAIIGTFMIAWHMAKD